MNLFKKIDNVYSKILTLGDALSAFMILILMLLITADVLSRTIFNHPFQGVSEIVSNCIIILCFLEIPYILMRGSHVRTTMLYDRLGPKGKSIIDIIGSILGIAVYVLIIMSSWGLFVHAFQIHDAEVAGTVRITTVPGRFSVILGSALMVLEFVILLIKNIIRLKDPTAFPNETKESETPEGGNAI